MDVLDRKKIYYGILASVVVVVLALNLRLHFGSIADDAFISFRYAENFAMGKGLVFNPGERVEGYSNFLWTAGLGLGRMLGLPVVGLSVFLGIMALIIAAALSYNITLRIISDRFVAASVVVMVLTNFALFFYAISGMETMLFGLELTAMTWLFARNSNRISAGLALLGLATALTRPEGIMYFGLFILADVFLNRRIPRRMVVSVVLFAAGYVAFLLWRHWYYGSWVPNTFFAKMTTDTLLFNTGLDDVHRFIEGTGGPLMVIASAGVLLSASMRKAAFPLLPVLVGAFLFEAVSAGDWMMNFRFLAPIVPVFFVLSICGLYAIVNAVTPDRKWLVVTASVVLLVAFSAGLSLQFHIDRAKYPHFVMTSTDMIPAGKWVKEHYPSDYTIECWRIGALAYYSELRLVDIGWGLTDAYIAHALHRGEWDVETRDAYRKNISPELIMHGADEGEKMVFSSGPYRRVKTFPQGSSQKWVLYQRDDLPMPKL